MKSSPAAETGQNSSTPKHFVFVPGSFHGAWCWYKMQPLLNRNGHTSEAIDLPAHGLDRTASGEVTLGHYVDAVGRVLERYDKPIGHSRAGIVLCTPVNRTFEMKTNHSPFLSQPEKLAEILLSL